ncbi:hypothetical protein ElyMa_002300700 [Elysia marginata]|uniref:Chitin-binding type-2 domain-containing protein n=1 Tax=Elysia marginata TaxID=1093978 RepID=A0AAV4G371_9GAST|nr:hypothetical protein ElyMa_002300700 [Elysia marginata]
MSNWVSTKPYNLCLFLYCALPCWSVVCPGNARPVGPSCQCNDPNSQYNSVSNTCVRRCPSDATQSGNTCQCRDTNKVFDGNSNRCVQQPGDQLQMSVHVHQPAATGGKMLTTTQGQTVDVSARPTISRLREEDAWFVLATLGLWDPLVSVMILTLNTTVFQTLVCVAHHVKLGQYKTLQPVRVPVLHSVLPISTTTQGPDADVCVSQPTNHLKAEDAWFVLATLGPWDPRVSVMIPTLNTTVFQTRVCVAHHVRLGQYKTLQPAPVPVLHVAPLVSVSLTMSDWVSTKRCNLRLFLCYTVPCWSVQQPKHQLSMSVYVHQPAAPRGKMLMSPTMSDWVSRKSYNLRLLLCHTVPCWSVVCPGNARPVGSSCQCNDPNSQYNSVSNTCARRCPNDAVPSRNTCQCRDTNKRFDVNSNRCVCRSPCPTESKQNPATCACSCTTQCPAGQSLTIYALPSTTTQAPTVDVFVRPPISCLKGKHAWLVLATLGLWDPRVSVMIPTLNTTVLQTLVCVAHPVKLGQYKTLQTVPVPVLHSALRVSTTTQGAIVGVYVHPLTSHLKGEDAWFVPATLGLWDPRVSAMILTPNTTVLQTPVFADVLMVQPLQATHAGVRTLFKDMTMLPTVVCVGLCVQQACYKIPTPVAVRARPDALLVSTQTFRLTVDACAATPTDHLKMEFVCRVLLVPSQLAPVVIVLIPVILTIHPQTLVVLCQSACAAGSVQNPTTCACSCPSSCPPGQFNSVARGCRCLCQRTNLEPVLGVCSSRQGACNLKPSDCQPGQVPNIDPRICRCEVQKTPTPPQPPQKPLLPGEQLLSSGREACPESEWKCANGRPAYRDCHGACECDCSSSFAGPRCEIVVNASLCSHCHYFQGIYKAGIPGFCDLFVHCHPVTSAGNDGRGRPRAFTATIQKCAPGTFYVTRPDNYEGCDWPSAGTCNGDLCATKEPNTRFADESSCQRYWECGADRKLKGRFCCPAGQGFDRKQGMCVDNPRCPDVCGPCNKTTSGQGSGSYIYFMKMATVLVRYLDIKIVYLHCNFLQSCPTKGAQSVMVMGKKEGERKLKFYQTKSDSAEY